MSINIGLMNILNINVLLSSSSIIQKRCHKESTKYSIMNAHNKTQLSLASINYGFNNSNCHSLLSKILKFKIQA